MRFGNFTNQEKHYLYHDEVINDGTTGYMAPETLLERLKSKPNKETDIWSFGATALEIPIGEDAWAVGKEDLEVVLAREITAKNPPHGLILLEQMDKGLHEKLSKVLVYDPDSRPTAQELVTMFAL